MLCYNKSVNRKGHPSLVVLARVLRGDRFSSPSRGWLSFPICLQLSCLQFLQGVGWLLTTECFHGPPFLTAWRVAKAREYTHANKAVGRLTVDRHWQLGNRRVTNLLSIGITEVRRSLKPNELGQHQHRQPDWSLKTEMLSYWEVAQQVRVPVF